MKKFLLPRIGVADDQSSVRPSLHDCLEVVMPQAEVLMQDVLEGLLHCTTLGGAKSSFGNPFPVSKAAAEALYSQASALKQTFVAHLELGVYHRGAQDFATPALPRIEDFKLLDSRQIDASIELALARQEVSRCVDDVLPSLDALVSSLQGWITVQPQLNPIGVDVFVRALQASLRQHVAGEQVRAAFLLPAAGLLGVSLAQLYREICNWLRSQGVEPASPLGTNLGSGAWTSEAAMKGSAARTLLTFDKLRKLLAGGLDSSAGGLEMQDFLHTVPAAFVALEEMKLVEPMMRRLAQRESRSDAGPDGPHEPIKNKQLSKQLSEEVVHLMLDELMRDERLLERLREPINRLEPTLLALARSDPRFFSQRQHPARQFLDRLAQRSLGHATEDDAASCRFLTSIENAIDFLSGSGGGDGFAQVLCQLEEGWRRDDAMQFQRYEEVRPGVFQTEQGEQLALRFADDFEQRLRGKKIPQWLDGFLRGPWAQVAAQAQLGCLDGSADPGGYLALVDDLIWSVQLRLARRDRARLVRLVPDLLSKLRLGLQLIEYPQERVPALFDALVSVHEKVLGSRRLRVGAKSDPLRAPEFAEIDLPPALEGIDLAGFPVAFDEAGAATHPAPSSRPVSGSVQRPWSVADLTTGAWVDMFVNRVWLRAQLNWVSPQRTLFMFVSHAGLAHSMSRRTMERLRLQGSIRLVSDDHEVDNVPGFAAPALWQSDQVQEQRESGFWAMTG